MLEKHFGNTVLLNCRSEFLDENQWLLQMPSESPLFYAKIVEVDQLGIWIENPKWETHKTRHGDPQYYKTNVLLPWASVVSIATFPERRFDGDEEIMEQKARSIGFHHMR
jgi:hypothetical protein